ncbi:MAG: methyltransferase domain-containing protein [Gemmatimonas sp.]|nr:methyltransferase domain-containing protein [Gemmatimonas sp.]
MKEADDLGAYRLRTERFAYRSFSAAITLPESSEELIDEGEFGADERLPYWAELWPSARALARAILDREHLPARALELGAGLGLPSLALLRRGVDVLATDYYAEALRFARYNARHNRLPTLRTLHLDWRDPDRLSDRFPLVVAADVLYEPRNVDALVTLLPAIVGPESSFLLADPGRLHLAEFLRRMTSAGWQVDSLGDRLEPSPAGNGIGITVKLLELVPPVSAHEAPNL